MATEKKEAESIDEKMEKLVDSIEPTEEDFVNRRINHIPFAKVVIWLCYKSKNSDFVYASELSKFMKVTQTRAYSILRDLCRVGIMSRNNATATLVEFHFVRNSHNPIICKYLERAMRTLEV